MGFQCLCGDLTVELVRGTEIGESATFIWSTNGNLNKSGTCVEQSAVVLGTPTISALVRHSYMYNLSPTFKHTTEVRFGAFTLVKGFSNNNRLLFWSNFVYTWALHVRNEEGSQEFGTRIGFGPRVPIWLLGEGLHETFITGEGCIGQCYYRAGRDWHWVLASLPLRRSDLLVERWEEG